MPEGLESLLREEQEILATISQPAPEGMVWDCGGIAVPIRPSEPAFVIYRPDGMAYCSREAIGGFYKEFPTVDEAYQESSFMNHHEIARRLRRELE